MCWEYMWFIRLWDNMLWKYSHWCLTVLTLSLYVRSEEVLQFDEWITIFLTRPFLSLDPGEVLWEALTYRVIIKSTSVSGELNRLIILTTKNVERLDCRTLRCDNSRSKVRGAIKVSVCECFKDDLLSSGLCTFPGDFRYSNSSPPSWT